MGDVSYGKFMDVSYGAYSYYNKLISFKLLVFKKILTRTGFEFKVEIQLLNYNNHYDS